MIRVLAIEIILPDISSPVTADAAIGLYARSGDVLHAAASGVRQIFVDAGARWRYTIGDQLLIGGTELVTIAGIVDTDTESIIILTDTLQMSHQQGEAIHASSVFRWVQNGIGSLTGWASGILLDGGISGWSQNGSDVTGVVTDGVCTVAVSDGVRLPAALSARGISILGAPLRVWEIDGTRRIARWYGLIDDISWTASRYTIKAMLPHKRRQAQLLTTVDVDGMTVTIPATFGELRAVTASGGKVYTVAALVRKAKSEHILANTDLLTDASNRYRPIPAGADVFPVSYPVDASIPSSLAFYRDIHAKVSDVYYASYAVTNLIGRYVKVVDGAGQGEYRIIASAGTSLVLGLPHIALTVSEMFAKQPTAGGDDPSYIQLVSVDYSYVADAWECGGLITDGRIYIADRDGNNGYSVMPQQLIAATDDTTVQIEPREMDADGGCKAWCYVPVTSPRLCTAYPTLAAKWNQEELASYVYRAEGVYFHHVPPALVTSYLGTQYGGSTSNLTDKNFASTLEITTHCIRSAGPEGGNPVIHAIEFELPASPENFEWDTAYLSVYLDMESVRVSPPEYPEYLNDGALYVFARYPLQLAVSSGKKILEVSRSPSIPSQAYKLINFHDQYGSNIPDAFRYGAACWRDAEYQQYYSWNGYYSVATRLVSGRTLFKLGLTNENYGRASQAIIAAKMVIAQTEPRQLYLRTRWHELAVLFEASIRLTDEIYGDWLGRVYADTWGGRKDSTAVIRAGVDMVEHVSRLQAWCDTCSAPTGGWGKAYARGALIVTGCIDVGDVYGDTIPISDYTAIAGLDVGMTVWIADEAGAESAVVAEVSSTGIKLESVLSRAYSDAVMWIDGCFDAPDIRRRELAGQALDESDGYTDALKERLCREAGLLSYTDAWGRECVKDLIPVEDNYIAKPRIVFDYLSDRGHVAVEEPSPEGILIEPVVRYGYDPNAGRCEQSIAVTQTDAPAYESSFVVGLTGKRAEQIWGACRVARLALGANGTAQGREIELRWHNSPRAVDTAAEYLYDLVRWQMCPRVRVQMHYSDAVGLQIGQRVQVRLAQIADKDIDAFVLGKTILGDIALDKVELTLVVLRSSGYDQYWYQDTMTEQSYGNWLDTMSEYGDTRDKQDTM